MGIYQHIDLGPGEHGDVVQVGSVERHVAQSIRQIGRYIAISADIPVVRPKGVVECWLLVWPAADLRIPWPSGMTPREALLAWATQQEVT